MLDEKIVHEETKRSVSNALIDLFVERKASRIFRERLIIQLSTLNFQLLSINRQTRIHIPRPGINPTLQVFHLPEPRADKEFEGARRTRP